AVDSSGNVYVTDSGNVRIQKFNSSGAFLTMWAGNGGDYFEDPWGIAVDPSNNVFVSDGEIELAGMLHNEEVNQADPHQILKFNSTGGYLAKYGAFGQGDGQFYGPKGVVADLSGNIYIADSMNNRIQKLSSTGTFLAKWGSLGTGNGQFSNPSGVAADVSGNIYVTDTGNNRIQKFSSDGKFMGIIGSGGSGDGEFLSPNDIVTDSSGNIYVADTGNNRIQKFSSQGPFLAKWGTNGTGDGQFMAPAGIATDLSGNVYVADTGNNRIQKFSSSGTFLTKWGYTTSSDGQFNTAASVAADSSGYVYVADDSNNRIQKFGPTGIFLMKWGSLGTGDGQFNISASVAADSSGNIYVADTNNYRIQKFSSSGTFLTKWGSYGTGDGQFNTSASVAADSSGNIYIADTGNNRIQKFSSSGTFLTKWGANGTGDGQFMAPAGIAADSSGNVYIADTGNNRIQKFNSTGSFLAKWGTSGSEDGNFSSPNRVSVDSSGNVFVADTGNNRIQKFNSAGTFLVKWGLKGVENGNFDAPKGVTVDKSGNVFVADTGNSRIQKFAKGSLGADFTATPTSGNFPLTVQFNDTSTGSPTAWEWVFDDWGTSTLQNPSHTYTSPGNYTVSLTIKNGSESFKKTVPGCIRVTRSDLVITQPSANETRFAEMRDFYVYGIFPTSPFGTPGDVKIELFPASSCNGTVCTGIPLRQIQSHVDPVTGTTNQSCLDFSFVNGATVKGGYVPDIVINPDGSGYTDPNNKVVVTDRYYAGLVLGGVTKTYNTTYKNSSGTTLQDLTAGEYTILVTGISRSLNGQVVAKNITFGITNTALGTNKPPDNKNARSNYAIQHNLRTYFDSFPGYFSDGGSNWSSFLSRAYPNNGIEVVNDLNGTMVDTMAVANNTMFMYNINSEGTTYAVELAPILRYKLQDSANTTFLYYSNGEPFLKYVDTTGTTRIISSTIIPFTGTNRLALTRVEVRSTPSSSYENLYDPNDTAQKTVYTDMSGGITLTQGQEFIIFGVTKPIASTVSATSYPYWYSINNRTSQISYTITNSSGGVVLTASHDVNLSRYYTPGSTMRFNSLFEFGSEFTSLTTPGTYTVSLHGTDVSGTVVTGTGSTFNVTVLPVERDPARLILSNVSLYQNTATRIPIRVMNITSGTGISFNLTYDPSVIRVNEITLNQSYASGSSLTMNATSGLIRLSLTSTDGITIGSPVPVFFINTTGTGAVGSQTPLTLTSARWGDGTFNYRTFDTVNGAALVYRYRGDLNGNTEVDIGDTAKTAYMVVGKTPDLIPDADFNNNGRIDVGDASKIACYIVGRILEL
ncbi:MAG: 6-bladed beta-propeller, partial [Methanoregula sp.]|nr:6-bladed beta-propeller [Methanoregula sp.]